MKVSDSLTDGLYQNEDHKNRLIEVHRKYLNKSQVETRSFIIENPNSYFTLDLLFRNRKHIAKTALKNSLSRLDSKYADNIDPLALSRYLNEGEGQLAKDSIFIDFEVSDITGKSFRLSSLKSDYIYLSFWNAGCGPCRQENRFFSENYDQLPDNLKLVSFSTDKAKEQWVKASERDDIKWANVSDLGGIKGDMVTSYGVVVIPNSYLIGKDGRIIEHFVAYEDNTYQLILNAIASKELISSLNTK